MSKVKAEELDFESMSQEELKLFIDSEGKELPKNESEPSEDTTETEEVEEESTESEETEQPVEEKEEKQVSDINPRFKDKSVDDFIEMQLNADRKISQQGNELHDLKRQLTNLKEVQETKANSLEANSFDDMLKDYAKEDIKAIETLIDRKIRSLNAEKTQVKERERQAIAAEHDTMWENLKQFNPELFYKIETSAKQEMQGDLDNTFYRKGWLAKYISGSMNGNGDKKAPVKDETVIKRKVKASTVNGQGAGIHSDISQKDTSQMSSKEFAEHMKAKGIDIFGKG